MKHKGSAGLNRSAISGRYVTHGTPRTTVTETVTKITGKGPSQSPTTGQYYKLSRDLDRRLDDLSSAADRLLKKLR